MFGLGAMAAGSAVGLIIDQFAYKKGEYGYENTSYGAQLGFGMYVAFRQNKWKEALAVGVAELITDLIPRCVIHALNVHYLVPNEPVEWNDLPPELVINGFQSFSNGVYTYAMGETRAEFAENWGLLIDLADTAISSVFADWTTNKDLTASQISVNALEAVGNKFTTWLIAQGGLSALGIEEGSSLTEETFKTVIISVTTQLCVTFGDAFFGVNYR